ncbi:MAG: ABC transporter ATP-binding protein [Candidatus Spechtbacterales bacterium]|nr:ABC transporter ATP-binding protein [Candidatus Spechtbacterales bacterium]
MPKNKNKEYNSKAVKTALRDYFGQIKRDWKFAVPALLMPGIGNILVFYVPPLVIAKILTRFAENEVITLSDALPYVGAFAGVWFLGEMVWRFSGQLFNRAAAMGVKYLYTEAMENLLEKDLVFFHDNFSGSLTKKVIRYARSYEGFLATLMFSVFSSFIPLIFVVAILWQFSPWLILVLVSMVAITTLITTPLIKRRAKLVEERESASNKVAGYVADIITNVDAVRAFAHEDYEKERHHGNVENYVQKSKKTWDYHNMVISMTISPLYVITNALGLLVALMLSNGGGFNLEAVFVTFSYFSGFTKVMWDFSNIYRNLETQVSEAAQFTEVMLHEPKIKDKHDLKISKKENLPVEFRNVNFCYEENYDQKLFNNLNIKIKEGEKVGLVGRSGGGKSTITKLLMRFMDIQSGEILIGGVDISKMKQKDLRNLIAYVPQEPIMFHRSILENIRYGKLDATDDEVKKAAEMAHADIFIKNLSKKYDTLIGERGVKLSGGQRQRIAIARAVLRDAPILILDEATSSLDSESERFIQDALEKLMENKTAIVIAHRLSTIQKMDKILVLNEGEIIEKGSHRELLERGGQYAKLWKHQTGNFLKED